jgi:hypothetical protein
LLVATTLTLADVGKTVTVSGVPRHRYIEYV